MREKALERIGHLYPKVDLPAEHGGGKSSVIAWIWSRTVPSPDPAFESVQVPIASSFFCFPARRGEKLGSNPLWIVRIKPFPTTFVAEEPKKSWLPRKLAQKVGEAQTSAALFLEQR